MVTNFMQKILVIDWLAPVMMMVKESCYVIGQEIILVY